jgi:hypothetical protein
MSIEKEMKVVTDMIQSDQGYRYGWQANIAMAFKDEWQRAADNGGLPCTPEQIHEIANKAADNFLNLLCYRPKDNP